MLARTILKGKVGTNVYLHCQRPHVARKFIRGPRMSHVHGSLRLHHGDGRGLELGEVGGGAVLEQHAFKAAVVRLPHCRLHTDLCGHSDKDQMRDATGLVPQCNGNCFGLKKRTIALMT